MPTASMLGVKAWVSRLCLFDLSLPHPLPTHCSPPYFPPYCQARAYIDKDELFVLHTSESLSRLTTALHVWPLASHPHPPDPPEQTSSLHQPSFLTGTSPPPPPLSTPMLSHHTALLPPSFSSATHPPQPLLPFIPTASPYPLNPPAARALEVCATFKSVFYEYKSMSEAQMPKNPWRFQTSSLFIRLDAFLERCHDMQAAG